MIFKIFRENSHNRNGHFQEILKNHIWGELVNIQEFILVMIYVILPQKRQFRLKNESFEISRNSPYVWQLKK